MSDDPNPRINREQLIHSMALARSRAAFPSNSALVWAKSEVADLIAGYEAGCKAAQEQPQTDCTDEQCKKQPHSLYVCDKCGNRIVAVCAYCRAEFTPQEQPRGLQTTSVDIAPNARRTNDVR